MVRHIAAANAPDIRSGISGMSSLLRRLLDHSDCDTLRIKRWLVWDVVLITQQHLQCMLAWRQIEARLGLAEPEVKVIAIVWDRLIERRKIDINQRVVVTGVGLVDARGRDARTAESHSNPEGALDHLSIRRPDNVDLGIRRHGRLLRGSNRAGEQETHQYSREN